MVSLNLFRRQEVASSVLDVPLSAYDAHTGLPKTIKVGEEDKEPFVSFQEVKDHLIFLSAISKLQSTLPTESENNLRSLLLFSSKPYASWAQHVLPQRKGSSPLTREELPSLGVLMAWHAHLLNPTVYENDLAGAYKALKGYDFPLRQIATALKEDGLPPDQPLSASEEECIQSTAWTPEDIAKAVQRQAKFVGNMERIGWLSPAYWEAGWAEVQFGIVLYHAWLDLVHATKSRYFLVPRLDIDLAWHTHQLHHERYRSDTTALLGKMLNHDDMAGDGKLGDGLKVTRKLWKRRFGYCYQ